MTNALPLSYKDGDTLIRALLNYETTLSYSQIFDSTLVFEETQRVRSLIERVSLTTQYPIDDFPDPEGGDGE